MRVQVGREDCERLAGAVNALLPAEPYLAYANFPAIARRPGALAALHRQRVMAAAHTVLVARDQQDRPLALLYLEDRPFESEHFGLRMAKIEPVAAVPDDALRLEALRRLYATGCDTLRDAGYQHLAATASTQDRVACWVLQELGAFHVGTKISWMQPLTGTRTQNELGPDLHIEVYEYPTAATLERARWRRLLEWAGTAFDRGPAVFDLTLPLARSTALYQVWTEKALTAEWAEALLVVCDGREVVGFHSMLRLPDLSTAAGDVIVGRGIGASLPGYPGVFTALQLETAAVRPLGAAYLENETQASTIQSIQVFGKLGHRCIRSIASFHVRLDRDAPAAR